MDKNSPVIYPAVAGEFETVAALLEGKSLARFGDGELKLMHGAEYFREPAQPELAEELQRILRKPSPDCLVGIPTMAPEGPKYENWLRHRDRFALILRPGMKYYSAFVTRPDSAPWINTRGFAWMVEKLWRGKKAVIMSEPKNSILKAVRLTARKTKHICCPSRQAYAEISRLEAEIRAMEPEIALLSCGPTATCLADRLSAAGIHAIDIGSGGGYLLKLLLGGEDQE